MTTLLKNCLLALFLVPLTGCGALDFIVPKGLMDYVSPKGHKVVWESFSVFATNDANLNSPVALDVVMLRDDATLNMVASLPASKWFASRGELEKTFPQGLRVKSIEIAPGQTLRIPLGDFGPINDFGPGRVMAVMVFADYLTPGEHRIRVDQLQGEVLVQLGARVFTVTAQPTK
jgi:type VI secretion system protein